MRPPSHTKVDRVRLVDNNKLPPRMNDAAMASFIVCHPSCGDLCYHRVDTIADSDARSAIYLDVADTGRQAMAGNRALYDRAMEQSREAARQKNWDEALKQAVRALQEFPQDADGRSSAAVALFNTGKYPQALQMLEELRDSDPDNPFSLEYLASTHERMGNTSAAVTIYTQLADLQQGRRLSARAIEALHEVLRLRPDADDQRLHLARLLEEAGSPSDT